MNKKAQGLPISTIIIIVLVVIVLIAVGLFFFTQFTQGTSAIGEGSEASQTGSEEFRGFDWEGISGAKCHGQTKAHEENCKINDKEACEESVLACEWR